MARRAVVAGQFYPARSAQLEKELSSLLAPVTKKYDAIGVVAPHAGYIYSGSVAGTVYASLKKVNPTAVILGPNHTGYGEKFSLMSSESWITPLGEVKIDKELSDEILKTSRLIKEDSLAHRSEHSIEVQLPFLQRLRADIRIVPIVISCADITLLTAAGKDIANAIKKLKRDCLIIASSDMTHYEDQQAAKSKDSKAIDAILRLDESELVRRVERYGISMCGYAPTSVMLTASKELGAEKAELIKYQTSGDVSGDYSAVVGYAGLIIG